MHMKLALMAALLSFGFAATPTTQIALPGCPDKCGDVEIPYPFGVGDDKCFLDAGFNLTCDGDSKLWTTQFNNEELPTAQSQISRIDPGKGTMEILMPISRLCFNQTGGTVADTQPRLGVGPTSFSVSGDENKFFTLGCNTYGYLHSSRSRDDPLMAGSSYSVGCISQCGYGEPDDMDVCSGIGCCNLTVPAGMRKIQADAYSFGFDSKVWGNCSYSFVAKNGWFRSSVADLSALPFSSSLLVVDWAVGDENQTCGGGGDRRNICTGVSNTECVEAKTKQGYHCRCKDGYGGNPYLGCQNIDECKEGTNSCHGNATCNDIPGNYTCTCNKGFEGDGRKDGKGCVPKSGGNNTLLVICLSVSLSVIALLVLSFYVYWGSRKRRLIKLKEQFFQQNGGLLLTQQLGGGGGSGGRMRIYTLEDLKKATNNFDEKAILGQGGFGTVYKGTVGHGGGEAAVAIKKSKICDQSQVAQFINEVVVLSQINHRNVVKLLGCCLETQVPLLVYEFITNGTLSDHLHLDGRSPKMPFHTRLRVAAESAGALSYLHSAASPPIIHRDVKTANILLDDRLTAKVSDFGASRLVPLEQTQEKNANIRIEKRGYYSGPRNVWGVVFERLLEVAEIARRCLNVRRDERPKMREVAAELEGVRSHLERDDHPWGLGGKDEMPYEETQYLLKETKIMSSPVGNNGGDSSITSGEYSGLQSMDLISMSLMKGGR
ncbi:unnamed protein product [Cuscuta campestris]|uniref:Protein kinase domain-containing protein n=1 Tax=Cuscuta campestris TaxID=132261 RepID=A0A484MDT7_9ASTE|nr:unnamed protein product [Cuscuta campestris]